MDRLTRNRLIAVDLNNLAYYAVLISNELLNPANFPDIGIAFVNRIVGSANPENAIHLMTLFYTPEYIAHLQLAANALITDTFEELPNETKAVSLAMLKSDANWFNSWFKDVPNMLNLKNRFPADYNNYIKTIDSFIMAINSFIAEQEALQLKKDG